MTPIAGGGTPVASEPLWTLRSLGVPAVAFVVYGDPAPQGSKKSLGMVPSKTVPGKMVPLLVESSAKRVKTWRGDVVDGFTSIRPAGWTPVAVDNRDAVVLDMVFTRNRPGSLPKSRRCWPGATPDLSKLARSTEDALKTAGVYQDDARIVSYRRLDKVYAGDPDPDALSRPGAVIRMWVLRGSVYDSHTNAGGTL